jgi:hypothetical protein
MAIQEFEPQAEPDVPNITLLREFENGQTPVYHFFVNGHESLIQLRREVIPEDSCYCYQFLFHGWEFASAEVISWPELTVIENNEITAGMDDLANLQAQRLMQEALPLFKAAIDTDFPGAYAVENPNGNIIY